MSLLNRLDKEERIINEFQMLRRKEVGLFPVNKQTKRIYKSINNTTKWKQWIDTSAKNELPPDFYNDKLKLMMDVMRIDDHAYVDEKGRVINRHNERESKLIEELISKNEMFKEIAEKGNLFITPDSGLRGYADHNYDFYVNNFKRVVSKHIKKIEKYKKNHPGFKTIFFVFDESSPYIKCFDERRPKQAGEGIFAHPHLWWFDKNMLSTIENSDIDYLIWMCPYKHFEAEVKLDFPMAIIYDVKNMNYSDCISYENKDMQSLEL